MFVLGLVFVYVFAVNLRSSPTSLLHSPGRTDISDAIHHLILPATVLAIVNAAPLGALHAGEHARRAQLASTSQTARAKGLVPRLVILRHALQNALIPIITHHRAGSSRRPSRAP